MAKKIVDREPVAAPIGTLRGLGWMPCERDERDYSASAMLGAPTQLPVEFFALSALVGQIYDQTITSSCVGFAIRNALQIRLRALGKFIEEMSAYAIYAWARMRAKGGVEDSIVDTGSIPRLAMKAISVDGVPREVTWPSNDPSLVNKELTWSAQQEATAGRVSAYYRIDSEGSFLTTDIMHAIVQMYPVVFGMFVDSAFMQLRVHEKSITWINETDPNGGGHMMCIVGYRTRSDGKREFLVLNSWGADWGNHGQCWVHEDVITKHGRDFFVMQVVAL